MDHHMALGIQKFFGSGTTKSVVISILLATAGAGGHAILQQREQADTIQQHTEQLKKLSDSDELEHKVISDIHDAVIVINGKIDVLSQKIDDDRQARQRGH